jgi:hypothetical protein
VERLLGCEASLARLKKRCRRALPQSARHERGSCVHYTRCIHYADVELAQQLLYVGVTRGRYDVFYV